MKPKQFFLSVFTLPLVLASTAVAAADTYQVTGPILEMTDNTLVVEKNGERWEIARDASTKAETVLKVGDKATVHYRMLATRIESKPTTAKDSKSERTSSPSKAEKSK
jgi:hypothetical protein